MKRKLRVAYLVSHPIQYQAPLLSKIHQEMDIDLTVFYCSDLSVRGYHDEGFGQAVQWDVPLLDGYRYEFLPAVGNSKELSFWWPFNYDLTRRLRSGKFDVLWVHGWAYWSHLLAVSKAKKLGIKVLIRGESGLHLKNKNTMQQWLKKRLMHYFLPKVHGFLAIGDLNRKFYLHHGVDTSRIFMTPYAVDNVFFRAKAAAARETREKFRASLGLALGRPVILYASKMIDRKRPDDLLEAYIRLSPDNRTEPQPYLIFIGDGELRQRLEERASQFNWSTIKFLGFRNQSELPMYYDLCNVFVLPSVQEPWGLVINEVMNAARAVIVSDQVGCGPDLVRHGENGFIFKAGDIDELKLALQDTLAVQDRCISMGEMSARIISNWSFDEDIVGLNNAFGLVGLDE